jgi:hypothetical protein
MRTWRLGLLPPPPGAPFTPADLLKENCLPAGKLSEVTDREPAITERLAKLIRDAAQGKVDADGIAPESRTRLVPFLQSDGPRFLGHAGALASLVLLEDGDSGGKRVRRYRSVFASGLRIIWTVGLSPAGAIVSLTPRPEN